MKAADVKASAYRRFVGGLVAALLCGGTLLQVECIGKVVRNVNPCGTILNCDPKEYDFMWQDKFPDWDIDPTCTIPSMCGGVFPYPRD